jgi:hypothetical protein
MWTLKGKGPENNAGKRRLTMETMTREQLRLRFLDKCGTTFGTVTVFSKAKLNKKDKEKNPNPFDDVYKMSRLNGVIGYEYQHSVNLQREREGLEANFEAEKRAWGKRVNAYLVEHNGSWYLSMKVQRVIGDVTYWLDDFQTQIEKKELEPFMSEKTETSRQEVDKVVIHRDIKLESIIEIKIEGEDYRITD